MGSKLHPEQSGPAWGQRKTLGHLEQFLGDAPASPPWVPGWCSPRPAALPATTRGQTWHCNSPLGSRSGLQGTQEDAPCRRPCQEAWATPSPPSGTLWQPFPTADTAATPVVMSPTPAASSWPGRGSALSSHSRCRLMTAARVPTAAVPLLGLLGAGHMAGAWRAHILCAVTGKFLSFLTPALQGRTR